MTSNEPPPYSSGSGQPYGYDPYSGQPYPPPQEYGGAYPPPMPPAPSGPAGYGYGYGYGYPPPPPQDDRVRNQAIGVLVTNIVATLLCCSPLAIAGIVMGAMAMGRAETQPDSARSLIKWGWGMAIGSAVLVIALIVALIVIGVASDPSVS